MCYYITGWNEHYEDRITRRMKRLKFVKQSTNLMDDNLITLMEEKDGAALYGLWRLVVSLGAWCEPRGVLVRKGGAPHTYETIASRVSGTAQFVKRAFDVLIQIGWIGHAETVEEAIKRSRTTTCGARSLCANARANARAPARARRALSVRATETEIRTEPKPESKLKSEPKSEYERAAAAGGSGRERIGLRAGVSDSDRVGKNNDDLGDDEHAEYETTVRKMLLRIADNALLKRIIHRRIGLDELRELKREYDEAQGPTRGGSSSAYFHGICQRRGYLPKSGGVE